MPLVSRRGRLANCAAARNSSKLHRLSDPEVRVERRHGQLAPLHPLEVDQVLVVVDDHRRDAVGHALLVVVRREGEERVAGVAVAEVDAALVDELEQGSVDALLGDRGQVGPRQQEHVGRVLAGLDRVRQGLGVGPALDGDVDPGGALVVGVDDALVRRDLGVAPPHPEGELDGGGVGLGRFRRRLRPPSRTRRPSRPAAAQAPAPAYGVVSRSLTIACAPSSSPGLSGPPYRAVCAAQRGS